MAVLKSIITPGEVATYSGVNLPFNPCNFRTAFNIELHEFRKCLGEDFRDELVEDLEDYSSVEEWDKEATYNAGDKVKFKGIYYIVKTGVTGISNVLPTVSTKWDPAPKFGEDHVEELFCNFLAPYLALSILARQLPFIISQITDKGVIQFEGRDYEPSDKEAIERLEKAIYSTRTIILQNLDGYITKDENKVKTIFKSYIKNLEISNSCNNCGKCKKCKTGRRVGVYRFG